MTTTIKPTWATMMPALILALTNGTDKGVLMARSELMRLAGELDKLNARTPSEVEEAYSAQFDDETPAGMPWLNAPGSIPDPQYLSACPKGHDTVLGYLAKKGDIIEGKDGNPEYTQRDGWWLMHRCRERGIEPVKVQACPMLVQQGIYEVNAYPVFLLAERFG